MRQHTVSFPLQQVPQREEDRLSELKRMGIDVNQLAQKRLSTCSEMLPSRRSSLITPGPFVHQFPQISGSNLLNNNRVIQSEEESPFQQMRRLSIASAKSADFSLFPKPLKSNTRPLGLLRTSSFHSQEYVRPPGVSTSHQSYDKRTLHEIRNKKLETSGQNNELSLAERINIFKEKINAGTDDNAKDAKILATRKRFNRLRSVVKVVFMKPDGRPLTPVDESEREEEPPWADIHKCRYLRLPTSMLEEEE